LMGLYVETSKPADVQIPFLKANIHSQLQLIESEKGFAGGEFFLWLKSATDSRLFGVKMANGSGIYKPPKFIDVDDLLQFHHLYFKDILSIPLPLGSSFAEFLGDKSNWSVLLEALLRQFRTKLTGGVFVFGPQIGHLGTVLPEVESCIQPLVHDSAESLESDVLGNAYCVRLCLDLCALVLKETTFAQNIGTFAEDFERTLVARLPTGMPLSVFPSERETIAPTIRFYLTRNWTRLSVYPTQMELLNKQYLRSRFRNAFSPLKSNPDDSFVVSSNEI